MVTHKCECPAVPVVVLASAEDSAKTMLTIVSSADVKQLQPALICRWP